jgi:UDP-N-acetylmuramate--alanine ligase
MNALMAIAMAVNFGTQDAIAKALASKGKKTVFLPDKTDNLVYIDDYAHHPTEMRISSG